MMKIKIDTKNLTLPVPDLALNTTYRLNGEVQKEIKILSSCHAILSCPMILVSTNPLVGPEW